MKYYSLTGRRNHGRRLKRLLDTWDRNGSTSGPTPWNIYDDDDDDEKILGYKYLTIKIQRTWIVKAKVITLIIGTNRTISKSFRKYLGIIPGKQEIKEIQQKINHIEYCTRTSESTDVKVQNLFRMRKNVTCSKNCKYRTVASLYTLETWFVLVRNCNYLRKGEKNTIINIILMFTEGNCNCPDSCLHSSCYPNDITSQQIVSSGAMIIIEYSPKPTT